MLFKHSELCYGVCCMSFKAKRQLEKRPSWLLASLSFWLHEEWTSGGYLPGASRGTLSDDVDGNELTTLLIHPSILSHVPACIYA